MTDDGGQGSKHGASGLGRRFAITFDKSFGTGDLEDMKTSPPP